MTPSAAASPRRAREGRVARVAGRLAADGIAAALFEDAEGRRDQAVRYLAGHPADALLVVAADGRSVLVAWDLNLARLLESSGALFANELFAYADFERQPMRALADILARLAIPAGVKVELPSSFAYTRYVDFVAGLPSYDLVCRNGGSDAFVAGMRTIKDPGEIETYRRAAAITNSLIDELEARTRSGEIASELDAALFIERASREAGCEGPGFETLAAGPARSWGIHAFPGYGMGPFATRGLSILDFGLKLEGYTTDVTMSFAAGRLEDEQERMIALVERAHEEAIEILSPGVACRDVALHVDEIFTRAGLSMPHALGHGIGLDAHEAPAIRSREDCTDLLSPGQIVTIEPGLYHPELGGARLEDDILITEAGHEVLTRSRIVRL